MESGRIRKDWAHRGCTGTHDYLLCSLVIYHGCAVFVEGDGMKIIALLAFIAFVAIGTLIDAAGDRALTESYWYE